MRIAATARGTLNSLSGSGAIKAMPQIEIDKAVQLLDLMLEFFADVAIGRAALMMTERAATALSAPFSILAVSIACRRRRRSRSCRTQCPAPAFRLSTSTTRVAAAPRNSAP